MAGKLGNAPLADVGRPDLAMYQNMLSDWWEATPDLIWPQSVITWGRMRHDAQLKAIMQAFLLPAMRATWAVDGTGCRQEVVDKVCDGLGLPVKDTTDDPGPARTRGVTWRKHLRDAMSGKLVFGHAVFERRYRMEPDGSLQLDNLGQRMPWTIAQVNRAMDGSVNYIKQYTQQEPITANRLVWYVNELEGSNWVGTSALRSAYGPWLLKHELMRVHATGIRRFSMGVPVVEAPLGATKDQVTQASQMAMDMRVGEQSGAGLPSGFKFLLQGLQGSVPDPMAFIVYLDQQMSKMALAGLLDFPGAVHGSKALGETLLDLFLQALQTVADDVAEEATSGHPQMPGIVTDLVAQNWGEDEPSPRIVCTDLGNDNEVTAEAIMLLMQGGAITPDPDLEAWIRTMYRLPPRKPGLPPAPAPGTPTGDQSAPQPAQEQAPPAPAPGTGQPVAAAHPYDKGLRPLQAAAGAPAVGHRQLTDREVRAGFDPAAIKSQFDGMAGWVLSAWPVQVYASQRQQVVEQVQAAVDKKRPDLLTQLHVDSQPGADLLHDAMTRLAQIAAAQLIREAATQGVTIDPARVKLPAMQLGKVAMARAAAAAGYMCQQAGQKALQIAAASTQAPGDQVGQFTDGLSSRSVAEQVHAALMAAQNAGRFAAVDAAPASAKGTVEWQAVELLDENTCEECAGVDGTIYATQVDAEADYPGGGYTDCAGMFRCRGTVAVLWGGG